MSTLEITPSVTVHALLVEYPELEDVLIGMSPPFKKLKNPILRKTVAKVATIKHISSVGKIPLNDLISQLREAVGQDASASSYADEDYFGEQPDWFDAEKVAVSVDEADAGDENTMTLVTILREAKDVKPGQIIELETTFLPAPGIDAMRDKGYSAWTVDVGGGVIKSYFLKN